MNKMRYLCHVMISIIIPLYNKGELIGRTLRSIAAQENVPVEYEVVVVDDGSTDGCADIARRVASETGIQNFRVIPQTNAGVGAARNRGIAEARGEYVAFLDADDIWKPSHLRTLAELAERYPQCLVCATNYENLMPDGRTVPNMLRDVPFKSDCGVIERYFAIAATSNPPLWTSALMVRTEAIRKIGGFPTGIKSGEDLLTWARLAASSPVAYCLTPSAVYVRGCSNARPPEAVDLAGKGLEEIYRSHPELPGLKQYLALWYNMRMSRCLAHCMYGNGLRALLRSLRYRPTLRIAKPLLQYTLLGLRNKNSNR